jgi:hypothetical protein
MNNVNKFQLHRNIELSFLKRCAEIVQSYCCKIMDNIGLWKCITLVFLYYEIFNIDRGT